MLNIVQRLGAGLCALALLATLAGCSSKKDETSSSTSTLTSNNTVTSPTSGAMGQVSYKDGTYTAEDDYNEDGYKAVVTATIENGRLSALRCDELDREGGSKKALSESGQYGMKEKSGAAAEWHEEVAAFEKAVVQNGLSAIPLDSNGKTDAVTGCTISVSRFASLTQEALDKALA